MVSLIPYLTQSLFGVVLHESDPSQIRQLILYYFQSKEYVDGFVWEFTFAKRLLKHLV